MNDRKRAVKILCDTYWSPRGWKSAGNLHWQPSTPSADLTFAIAQGVMFSPLVRTHDDAIRALITARDHLTSTAIGSAFVSTLSSRRLDLRSALATYAVARHLPPHTFTAAPHSGRCAICGGYDERAPIDVNVLSFERYKWGGVRHDDPIYISLDLEWFARENLPTPSATDVAMLKQVLEVASSLNRDAKLTDLVKALAPVFPGSTDERRALIGILGYAGVLQPSERPGYLDRFVSPAGREQTPWHKDDWPYPVRWWRGGDGVNETAVDFWFSTVTTSNDSRGQ